MRDHKNQGEGLKGLVFNSVIDLKVYSDFSSLSVEDMFFHLHIASIYYGLPTTKSVDLATMTLHNISQHNELIQSEKKALSEIYQISIVQVLAARGIDEQEVSSIVQEINDCVQTAWQIHGGNLSSVKAPVNHKTIRAVYIEGHNSIVKNLPIPTVSISHKAAYISAKQIVNHILARGIDVMFFHAGHEEDWVDQSGHYRTKFLCNLHQNVSSMTDVSTDTRILLVRVWSDGFEAHQIKGKNEYNSLQMFTLLSLPPTIKIPAATQHHLLCAFKDKTKMISSSSCSRS